VPPFVCWAYAGNRRRKSGHTPVPEMVESSGLNRRMVLRIRDRITWQGVRVEVADAFMRGCGVNPNNCWRMRKYLRFTTTRKQPLRHLTPSQQRRFMTQLRRWAVAQQATGSV
jgi:hypothetical protein